VRCVDAATTGASGANCQFEDKNNCPSPCTLNNDLDQCVDNSRSVCEQIVDFNNLQTLCTSDRGCTFSSQYTYCYAQGGRLPCYFFSNATTCTSPCLFYESICYEPDDEFRPCATYTSTTCPSNRCMTSGTTCADASTTPFVLTGCDGKTQSACLIDPTCFWNSQDAIGFCSDGLQSSTNTPGSIGSTTTGTYVVVAELTDV